MCPVCHHDTWNELLSAEVLRMETLLRAQFVYDRVPRAPSPEERKDLTDFAHSADARILQCASCGTLNREDHQEPVGTYAADPYDTGLMQRLLPRYAAAFAAKATPYRSLLPAGARVLEIGPHLGGFLQTARDWGWNVTGIDVGADTTAFLNTCGLETRHGTLESCALEPQSHQAIFIWNCFEQIPEPASLLAECRRVLAPGGILVLRVPNAAYYLSSREILNSTVNPEVTTWITRALGYSNLLAWPYLYGYTAAHLDRLAEGFTRHAALNSELIILPFPELPDWVVEEKNAALAALENLSAELRGPWIELIYRAA